MDVSWSLGTFIVLVSNFAKSILNCSNLIKSFLLYYLKLILFPLNNTIVLSSTTPLLAMIVFVFALFFEDKFFKIIRFVKQENIFYLIFFFFINQKSKSFERVTELFSLIVGNKRI